MAWHDARATVVSGSRCAVALLVLLVLPAAASAQASVTGVIRDTSGGVLPGVTVEAASPALIERVRTVVTDGTGQYRIVDLRPGTYTITFTLPGFATVRREEIALTGTFTATVNAELSPDFQVEKAVAGVVEGRRDELTEHLVDFGVGYAEQARRDHALFVEAFREGRIGGVSAT